MTTGSPPTSSATRTAPSRDLHSRRSHVRWTIAFLAALGMLISYMDRTNLSVALPFMEEDLGISAAASGLLLGAFYWTYSAFQIPFGRLVDRFGPRFLLGGAVIWWSICTALVSTARGFGSLLGLRLLLGAGEAAGFPSIIKTVSTWFPRSERGVANAIVGSGSRAGSLLALPVVTALVATLGWRGSFIVTGAIGVVWAAVWIWYYRSPRGHRRVSETELSHITQDVEQRTSTAPKASWRALLRDRNVVAVALGFWCLTFVEYFFITWFPSYLVTERGYSLLKLGILGSIPAITAVAGQYFGGWCADALVRHGWTVTRARKTCITIGALGSSVIALAAIVDSPAVALTLLAVSTACIMFAIASIYCLPGDMSVQTESGNGTEGAIAGIINGVSNTAGIASPALVGLILGATGSFVGGLALAGAVAILGALIFGVVMTRLEPRDFSSPQAI